MDNSAKNEKKMFPFFGVNLQNYLAALMSIFGFFSPNLMGSKSPFVW